MDTMPIYSNGALGVEARHQHPNPYNRFLPYADCIDKDAENYLVEIKSNLAKVLGTTPLNEKLFSVQSSSLRKYITLYGMRFSKEDHIYFIKIYYGLLTTPHLDSSILQEVLEVLDALIHKKYLFRHEEVILEWKPLFNLYYRIEDSGDAQRGLVKVPGTTKLMLKTLIKIARSYFSEDSTQEMLDEWLPMLCFCDRSINSAWKYFELFLPASIRIPKEKSYLLWFDEFMTFWEAFGNSPSWEVDTIKLYARLAWSTMGLIDWEPHMETIYTKAMNSFNLPVTYGNSGLKVKYGSSGTSSHSVVARLLVSIMGGEENSSQKYLSRMLQAIESYFYPANDCSASEGLHAFIAILSTNFVHRVHLERYNKKWKIGTPDNKKITDDGITDFVTSLLPISFHILFSGFDEERKVVFNNLATLRPALVVPLLLEKTYIAIESVTEPHKLTACLNALSACSRPLVENYPIEVIRLFNALLPGIDVNDMFKSTDIFVLLSDLLEMVWVVDFSDPASRATLDLTSDEEELLNKTCLFEDFVLSLIDRCITLVENSSREQTRHESHMKEDSLNDEEIAADAAISDTFHKIMYKCSPKIFNLAFNKMRRYVEGLILEPCVAGSIIGSMCKSFVAVQPKMALDFFVPHFCSRIHAIVSERDAASKHSHNEELQFVLLLLSEVLSLRGFAFMSDPRNSLLPHIDSLVSVLDVTLTLKHREEYETAGCILQNILIFLVHTRPVQRSVPFENPKWSREVYSWGKPGDLETLKLDWYVPNREELKAAEMLMNKYLLSFLDSLTRLSSGDSLAEKEEILRNLRLVNKALHGSSELLPPVQVAPFSSYLSKSLSSIHDLYLTLNGRHARQFVIEVLRKVQRYLLEKTPDDVDSIIAMLYSMDLVSTTFGFEEEELNDHMDEHKIIKNIRMNRVIRSKRHLESVLIDRIVIQHEIHLWLKNYIVNETVPLEMIHDLFELSTSLYSEVRSYSQDVLLKFMLHTNPETHHVLLPLLLPMLKNDKDVAHHQLKGALYVILSDRRAFFLDWKTIRALYPALIQCQHSDLQSVVDLLKEFSSKTNRIYAECTLYSKSLRKPKLSTDFYKSTGIIPIENSKNEVTDEIDLDFQAFELQVCQLVNEGNLHWRHKQMALGLMFTILVSGHVPPQEVVEMWLQSLLDEEHNIRLMASQALESILRTARGEVQWEKTPTEEVVARCKDKFDKLNINEVDEEMMDSTTEKTPGIRSDNLWLQYRNMSREELIEYWNRPFSVDPWVGFYSWLKPHVKLRRAESCFQGKPEYLRKSIVNFFTNEENLKKFFKMACLEHKKGEDFFCTDRGLLYSKMFMSIGKDPLFEVFLPYLKKFGESHNENEQRCAAELVYGIIIGSKFWPYEYVESVWAELLPILKTVVPNISDETIKDWEICMSGATNRVDPNRLPWLIEFLVSETLDYISVTEQGAYKEFCHLRLLNNLLIQNWRIREIYLKVYETFKKSLCHPYTMIRQQIASNVSTLVLMDVPWGNNKNFGTGFPTKKSFIDMVIPQLNLNFENPEFNGIVKQNGIKSESTDLSNEVNSSKMDVDGASKINKTLANGSSQSETTRLLETVATWVTSHIQKSSATLTEDVYNLLPFFCQFYGNETNQEVSQASLKALCYLSVSITPPNVIRTALEMSWKVMQSTSWKARVSSLEFVQVLVFTNFMSIIHRPELVTKTESLVVSLMADDTVSVRQKAAGILGGLLHSKFLDAEAQQRLLQHFRSKIRTIMHKGRNKKNKFTKSQTSDSKAQLAEFHAGILGLCAFVEAYPYDVPSFVPDILIELERHLHDPQPIPKTIKKTFQEFKRTHMDNWSEHKQKFTDEQLVAMTELLVSPNYYA